MKYLIPWNEVEITTTRSSGAGGQHVNKTNSAVVLRFDIATSLVLDEVQKLRLLKKLASRLVQETQILIRSEDQRDQKQNKEKAYFLLNDLINKSLIVPKKRFATKPTKSSVKRRLTEKTYRGEIKKSRSRKIDW